MPKCKSDKKKTSAELEADIQVLQAELEATVRDLQSRIDAKRALAEAAREQEREIEKARFNARFVDAAKDILTADCVRDGGTLYDSVMRHMAPECVEEDSLMESPETNERYAGPGPAQESGVQFYGAEPTGDEPPEEVHMDAGPET